VEKTKHLNRMTATHLRTEKFIWVIGWQEDLKKKL